MQFYLEIEFGIEAQQYLEKLKGYENSILK